MRRAKTVEEYVALVKDALYEIEEVRAAIEFDADGMGEATQFIDDIEESLKAVYDGMLDGSYCWRTGDLKFMEIIRDLDERVIPFKSLLIRINDTHRNGLEPDED